MRVTDFTFELPESLIAHYPQAERSSCRLLSLDGPTGALTHGTFTDLLDKLNPGDLLVFNNTRVIPARLFGRKASGGKIEVLVERMLDDKRILAHIRASKAPKPGAELLLGDDESIKATMVARHDALFEVEFNDERSVLDILNAIGHMPLPPYIDRPDEDADRELYQTVYSEKPGAVAAPTAGLHFDDPLLAKLRESEKELEKIRTAQALSQGADLAASAKAIGPVTVVASSVGEMPSADALRTLALDVRDRLGNERGTVVALGGVVGGKPSLVVATNEAAREASVKAGAMVRAIGKYMGGGGGGRDDIAQGGGTKPEGIADAIAAIRKEIEAL